LMRGIEDGLLAQFELTQTIRSCQD
jgi:hypothetical protein